MRLLNEHLPTPLWIYDAPSVRMDVYVPKCSLQWHPYVCLLADLNSRALLMAARRVWSLSLHVPVLCASIAPTGRNTMRHDVQYCV